MDFHQHFTADTALATHRRQDTDKLLRLIPGKHTNEFWHELCDAVVEQTEIIPLHERLTPDANVPIFIVITLQYSEIDAEATVPYDDTFLDKTVSLVSNSLKAVAGLIDGDDALITAVWGTPAYKRGKETAYTIRLQFPLARMAIADQKRHLRQKIIKNFKQSSLLDALIVKTRLSWESLLDVDVYSNGALMYGTGSHVDYDVDWYDGNGDRSSLKALKKLLPLEKHKDTRTGLVLEGEKHNKGYWLPILLSMGYEAGETLVPVTVVNPDSGAAAAETELEITTEQQYAEELLPLINLWRYKEPVYRKKIGMALYNIFDGKERGLDLWKEQINAAEPLETTYGKSKRQKKYDSTIEDELRDEYEGFSNNNPRTDITLEDLAAEDKTEMYQKWIGDKCDHLMVISLQPEHLERMGEGGGRGRAQVRKVVTQGAIARAFYMKNRRRLTFLQGKWYRFNGTYLELLRDGPGAEVNDFRKDYERFQTLLVDARNNSDGAERNHHNNLLTEINNVISNLDTQPYYNGVVRCLQTIIARRTRDAHSDYEEKVFATAKRWVLESRDKDDDGQPQKMLVRKGMLEDFCTKHSCVPYDDHLTVDSQYVRKSYNMDYKTFGRDADMVDFFDSIYSKALRRTNGEKRIIQWLGRPGTAKTTLKKQLDVVYGSYAFTPPSTILNGERTRAGNASPESALANNCCALFVEEPEKSHKVNRGWLTEASGGSSRHTRLLMENGSVAESTAQVTIISNDAIPMTPEEELKVRFLVMRLIAMYVPKSGQPEIGIPALPATKQERRRLHIYKRKELKSIMNKLAIGRLWRLVNKHGGIDFDDAIPVPLAVRTETKNYWNRYDHYTVFANRNLAKISPPTEEEGGDVSLPGDIRLTVDMVHGVYSYWFMQRFKGLPIADRNSFIIAMRSIIGDPNDDEVYEGYVLKNEMYYHFRDEVLTEVDDDDTWITVRELRRELGNWMAHYDPSMRAPSHKIFMIYMLPLLGPENYNRKKGFMHWTNVREPSSDDDDQQEQ